MYQLKKQTDVTFYSKSFYALQYLYLIKNSHLIFLFRNTNFNLDAVQEVLPLFVGTHDFRTFMGMNKSIKEKHCMFSIRTIQCLTFERAQTLTTTFNKPLSEKLYDFYEVQVTAKSFLYRQVRRIVGTLISVGYGRHSKKDVYELITIPGTHIWPTRISIAPACGLYLCEVLYRKEELELIKNYNESLVTNSNNQREIETY